jgi:hypothetical protein
LIIEILCHEIYSHLSHIAVWSHLHFMKSPVSLKDIIVLVAPALSHLHSCLAYTDLISNFVLEIFLRAYFRV